jgi:hypothetical protein
MQRRKEEETIDAASEELLDSMIEHGRAEESKTAANDDPFYDEDGDALVVPTMEALSILVDDASTQALPFQEILRRNLKVALRATEMAEIAYHAQPRQGTATALTQMQNMVKELMEGIEKRQDPSILRNEVMELVVKPLIFDFVKVMTSEADNKRASLTAIVPPESAGIVRHEMMDLLNGVKQGLDEAFEEAAKKLDELLGTKLKGR